MAYNRPSLQTIVSRIQSDIEARLQGTDSHLLIALLNVLSRAVGAVAHGLYGHQAHTARQIIPDTADSENLERQAYWMGRGMMRKAATAAIGTITITGAETTILAAGATVQRSDGVEYTTNADATIVGGTATVAVTATTTGQTTNATAGQKLTLTTPVAGINSSAIVAAGGISGGTDAESDAQLLARLKEYVASGANGCNLAQYEVWAKEVAGVTRAWAMDKWLGIGTVGLFFVRDGDASIFPDATEVQAVQDYIDALRPPGLIGFTAYTPNNASQNLTIKLSPNTTAVQAAVSAQLADLFTRANVEDGTGNGRIRISHIDEAISLAEGEVDHLIVSPVADIAPSVGSLATLGVITFQAL